MLEEIVQLQYPTPVYVGYSPIPANKKIKPNHYVPYRISAMHLHNEYEFLRVDRGTIRCVTMKSEFTAHEGDILFISSYTPHSTFKETLDMHTTLLQFRLPSVSDAATRYIARFANSSQASVHVFKKGTEELSEIKKCFDAIIDEYIEQKPFWSDYIYANLHMLAAALYRQSVLSDSTAVNAEEIKRILPVLEYINENYADELSTCMLSKMLSYNETYFCRLFKNAVGTTPINYINFVRVCKAEKLLKKGVGLLEVAYETGFSSLSYFNRVFKKYNHYAPSEYKKMMKLM